VDELRDSVQKLADHWKEEAEKQVELGRKAGSADFVARAEQLQVCEDKCFQLVMEKKYTATTRNVRENLVKGTARYLHLSFIQNAGGEHFSSTQPGKNGRGGCAVEEGGHRARCTSCSLCCSCAGCTGSA
jgi:hypothetical protein